MNKYMAMNDSLVCTKGSICGSGKARFGRHIHDVIQKHVNVAPISRKYVHNESVHLDLKCQ